MTIDQPLVSVIVAVYNVEHYLERCVDSLLSQTYANHEILLVDDGSTDGSAAICDDYANRNRTVAVVHKENGGLSDARNAGLLVASGDYVVFVDGDDLVAPCYIEHLMIPILNGDANFAICDLLETANPDVLLSSRQGSRDIALYSSEEALIECLKGEKLTVSACGKLGKRSLWISHPFPAGQVYEDLFTIPCLISQAGVVAHVPERLYGQVMREGSITRTSRITEKQYRDYDYAIRHNEELFSKSTKGEIRNAVAIRGMIESARLIRLSTQIENAGPESAAITQRARTTLRTALSRAAFREASARVQISVLVGLFSPKLQMRLFRLYQGYKASRAARRR